MGNAMHSVVAELMLEFAQSTGLLPANKAPRRYLWTDAFAVCNFLELYRQSSEEKYQGLALQLVDQVHRILGRHREEDHRSGWISGLNDRDGELHPTIGGLRIGKTMNERGPNDPYDDRQEWDRDGQYFHYLTKWMHALNRVNRATGDVKYNIWAIELAKTAHAKFTYVPDFGSRKRMYWKMSIDLSYPLVPSMGHHDPLDGFITYNQLQATASKTGPEHQGPDLSGELSEMVHICEGKDWATDDPLGLGGLLADAYRVVQLMVNSRTMPGDLLETLLESALLGLNAYARTNALKLPADYRLAFRELGLSIGLHAVDKIQGWIEEHPGKFKRKEQIGRLLQNLGRHVSMSEIIQDFWLEATHRESSMWIEHRDINTVMLATSLAPNGYLAI